MILRLPKRQESREHAPGPKRATATATITRRAALRGSPNRFRCGGDTHENPIAAVRIDTSAAVIGVRNPSINATPLPAPANAINQFSPVEVPPSTRYALASVIAVAPAAARKRSKPILGKPPGYVEPNRGKCTPLAAVSPCGQPSSRAQE